MYIIIIFIKSGWWLLYILCLQVAFKDVALAYYIIIVVVLHIYYMCIIMLINILK